ncbi:MAG: amidase family protein [Vicinamibacterales bacterium]
MKPAGVRLVAATGVACLVGAWLTGAPISGQSRPSAPVPLTDVTDRSIEDLQEAMRAGRVTSRQLVDLYLARIDAYDKRGPSLNAIITTNPRAREEADALDAERASRGPRGPLHGIPVVVKDNYETIDMPTSAGSIALAGFHPQRDAYQVARLKAAGAVILAKTNMHELAAGIVTVGSRFGQTRNPYDLDRNPGGSSGGTGAAVAASFAAAGMGSDTCGSIRNPASHNNLVGLRGTQGLSSRVGIVPLSSTQDIGGPLARSIADLAVMLDATVGTDPADPTTAVAMGRIPSSYRAALKGATLAGVRIGVVRSLFGDAAEDREVGAVVQRAVDAIREAGAEVSDVTIPGLDDLLRDSSMIDADFKFDLAEYLAKADNPPVHSLGEILERGLFHSALEATFRGRNAVATRDSEAARRARIKRVALRQAVESVLDGERLTVLLYPTLRRKPARIGEAQAGSNCQLSAHSGLPALGVPAGFTADGLPVGMDLLGGAFQEEALLKVGYALEQRRGSRRAPFSTPPLQGGQPPAPRTATARFPLPVSSAAGARSTSGAVVTLGSDPTTSQLSYRIDVDASVRDRLSAIWIHEGTTAKPGAARHLVFGAGIPLSGTLTLSAADRTNLANANLLLRFYTRDGGGSAADVPLVFGPEATTRTGTPLHAPVLANREKLDADLNAALTSLEEHPNDPEALIWVGRRYGYLWRFQDAIAAFTRGIDRWPDNPRFYRHRGHRYISLRQFAKAESDLARAAALVAGAPDEIEPDGAPNPAGVPRSTLQFNIWYHLGLARYLQGNYRGAYDAYVECLKVSTNDDSIVATVDWMWMTLMRLGRKAEAAQLLSRIQPTMDILENQSYHRRILMYKGLVTPEALLDTARADDTTIATQGYGVGNYYLVTGNRRKAVEIFRRVVAGGGWNAFGFVAAEADLGRLN